MLLLLAVLVGALAAGLAKSLKLALVEGTLAFLSLYAAVLIRFRTPVNQIRALEQVLGPLWPRAVVFAAIVVLCLLAYGLYGGTQGGRGRERPSLTGVVLRLSAAFVVASGALAALFYILPSLGLWRGATALAVFLAGCGILVSRLVYVKLIR